MKKKGHELYSLEKMTAFSRDGRKIIHYTCNAPNEQILFANGIYPIGDKFGCANNTEVVIIPRIVLERLIKKILFLMILICCL